MKTLNHTYLSIILAAVAMVMAACSSDDATNGNPTLPADGKAKVTLRIATGMEDTVTRTWEDTNAKTDRSEMMYQWTVLVTDGSAIKYKYSGTPDEAKAEIDDVCTDVEMTAGTYTVYSFANISEASLQTILGVAALNAGTALADADVTAATATINGNGYAPTADDANGFGSKGIPMSNKQTLTVPASGSVSKDLIVVRMLAKMELQITNSTGAAITVKKVTLTDITSNAANNLKLLPYYTTPSSADAMDYVHGDIRPNLNDTPAPATTDFVVSSSDLSINNGSMKPVTFYVNESATPTNSDHLFQLLIELDGGEYRYSLISDDASNHWNYIARNDYRIIPITLDDYHFQLVPYDFPPIGVYPVSVKELNTAENLYEFTFHDYGHFHLLPQVTKGSSTQVKYNLGSGDYWTLSTDWANSWFTAAAKGGTWLDADGITAKGFYRSGAGSTTADGDDEGQAPVWYLNDGTAGPQWDPAASANYQPFIFGYIADPVSTVSEDKKIYHEMKIRLYVGGSYRRDMIFRCYMTLSKDQMLYAPRRDATPRRPHHWAQE